MEYEPSEQEVMNQLQLQAMQSGQGQDPNSLYSDYMKEEKVKNILSQLNPDTLVEDIEHRIRGEKKNKFSGQWEKISPNLKPINELLISNYISFLGSILNQNTSLSNYSANEINNIMSMVIEYLTDDLTDNDETYQLVGNYNEMTRIANIVCISSFSVFKRALNGQEARRIFSSLRVTESLTAQPQKKGFLDFLKFWS
jgi:hypothetical protein